MAIKSIKAEFDTHGVVFLGGTVALNKLSNSSSNSGSYPSAWAKKLDEFVKCPDGESFSLCGNTIIKSGFYVKARDITFTETEHGNKGPAYWELADHAREYPKTDLARKMRAVLQSPGTPADGWTATLIAAMFLSEVVRNPRSFTVNLMFLDLIERSVKYGSRGEKELDFASLLTFDNNRTGKVKTYTYQGKSEEVGKGAAAGTVRGGKLPMSQLGAMEQYQTTTAEKFDYQKNFTQYAKQSTLNLQAPTEANVDYQFPNALLEKECTAVLRWLLAYFNKNKLQYPVGVVEKQQTLPPVWNQPAKTQTVKVDVTVPVTLTGLHTHNRVDTQWLDAGANSSDAKAKFLLTKCSSALVARQSDVSCLL